MTSFLVDWTDKDYQAVEEELLVANHRLHQSGIFDDDNLARMIDRQPSADFTISTMGDDANNFEWRDGSREGVPAKDLLALMEHHRFWINCRKMIEHHPEVADAINSIYDELERMVPGFVASYRGANMLISSPDAMVHYHLDIPVNMLWHIRGRKRVWVYPHFDYRFASQDVLEHVCTGEWTEDIPYDEAYDAHATVIDAEPGQLVTWPQFTPHRVQNLEGLNVSLSTEHLNPRANKRTAIHVSNRWLRRAGFNHLSADLDGVGAAAKQLFARVQPRVANLFREKKGAYTYPITFQVDPEARHGYRLLEGADDYVAPHLQYETR